MNADLRGIALIAQRLETLPLSRAERVHALRQVQIGSAIADLALRAGESPVARRGLLVSFTAIVFLTAAL
ncbi:MAG TPA: hypothetical protein VM489_01535 [Burkholderiales bacterium]|nr:hypothetical protein [Burkholderiales bacterium]